MAAPKGNEFWKLRGKHGRDRIIQDHKALEENANEYFRSCIENPIIEIDYKGKDADRVEMYKPKVFQKDEFAIFCGLSQWRSIEDLKKTSEDFLQVVTRIENTIKTQKFQYAAVGVFNSNIIARDLGLANKEELNHSGNIVWHEEKTYEADKETD
jgi:hypothetical protein